MDPVCWRPCDTGPLNPRVGALDLKEFCELRPGLIGWVVLNLGMAAKQLELHGKVTPLSNCWTSA